MSAQEGLDALSPSQRIAVRLTLIEVNLDAHDALSGRMDELLAECRAAGWWRFLHREGLLREVRAAMRAGELLLEGNEAMFRANEADLAAALRDGQ